MPDATVILVAEAVKTALQAASDGGTFGAQTFTATREYEPQFDVQDLGTLRVVVVPKEIDWTAESRAGQDKYGYKVDVAVIKKPATFSNANLDPLMYLAEQICDLFKKGAITITGVTAKPRALDVQNKPIFDPVMMKDKRTFFSLITLTYGHFR